MASFRNGLERFCCVTLVSALHALSGCGVSDYGIAVQQAKQYGDVNEEATQVPQVFITSEKAASELIRHLGSIPELRSVSIAKVDLSEEQLTLIGQLNDLVYLSLQSCNVSDEDLRHLSGLTNLKTLVVAGKPTPVSGNGLCHLSGMNRLEYLDLIHTPIRGPGLEELKDLPALSSLNLSDTLLNDDSVEYLLPLTQVGSLGVANTGLTRVGALELAQLTSIDNCVMPSDPELAEDRELRMAIVRQFKEEQAKAIKRVKNVERD